MPEHKMRPPCTKHGAWHDDSDNPATEPGLDGLARSVFTPKLGAGVMEALEAELLIRAVLIRPKLLSSE